MDWEEEDQMDDASESENESTENDEQSDNNSDDNDNNAEGERVSFKFSLAITVFLIHFIKNLNRIRFVRN